MVMLAGGDAADGPAVLQSLLPCLVLLHQDHVVLETHELIVAVARKSDPLQYDTGRKGTAKIFRMSRFPVYVT